MKCIHFLLLVLFIILYIPEVVCQPGGQNYIRTRFMLTEDGSQYMENIQYYDGLGRPYINVRKGITPNHYSLATLQEYDVAGRESKVWLPSVISSDYITLESFKGSVSNFYNRDTRPFSEPVYESSPLNRPIKQYGPGVSWENNPVATNYLTNTTTGELSCKMYTVTSSGKLAENGIYDAGELYVTKTTDEDWNKSYSFTDKLGQLVLSRQMAGIDDMYDTYYVYDDFGNCCFVLPPAYQDEPNLSYYAYQYKYDRRNRCVEKVLPGCDPIKYIYDLADNLILSQDGEQRESRKWTFYLYDKFRRQTVRGICTCDDPVTVEIMYVTCVLSLNDSGMVIPDGLGMSGYNSNFIFSSPEIQEINYYDNYSFLSLDGYNNKGLFHLPTTSGTGLLTGRVSNLLNTSTYLYSATYYDVKGRPIEVITGNHLGGYDIENKVYTFTDKLKTVFHLQVVPDKTVLEQTYVYSYDHADRLLKITHMLGSNSPVEILENSYDELGRLESERHHGNEILKSSYTYNIRGWLTGISGAKFTQNIYYDEYKEGGSNCFNGNISRMDWKSGDDSFIREYDFFYDNLNRLYLARYSEPYTYAAFYTYNKMGSIIALERHGVHSTADNIFYFKTIDNLTLNYDGNQLRKVTDGSSYVPLYNGALNYVDGANVEKEFFYDKNGNLVRDIDKGISVIQYNSLNLPSQIVFNSNRSIDYLYDSDGIKRRVRHVTPFSQVITPLAVLSKGLRFDKSVSLSSLQPDTLTTDYCGNVIYENGELSKILTPEGYITLSGMVPIYHYNLRDYQGNNRVIVKQDGSVEEVNHYYPYGGLFGESAGTNLQAYKFAGKELDRMHGLDWADFGGRYMRFDVPGWTGIDPLCEKYYSISPYVYCMSNPVRFVDPDGRNPILALYRAYKGYKAYKAARTATVAMRTADAAAVATATTATATYSYNYFLNPEQAAAAQQSLLEGIESIAKQNAAVSPEYENQRNRERNERNQRNQEQANIAKSIDTNISGTMPNGDPAPKRNPNDGGNKTKIAIGLATVGAGAAVVESVVEGTQPQKVVPQEPPVQLELELKEAEQKIGWLQKILNLF